MEIIGSIIIRSVTMSNLREETNHRHSEMTGQITSNLAASIRQPVRKFAGSVDQQMAGSFDRAASQHQHAALNSVHPAITLLVLNTGNPPARVVHDNAHHL